MDVSADARVGQAGPAVSFCFLWAMEQVGVEGCILFQIESHRLAVRAGGQRASMTAANALFHER